MIIEYEVKVINIILQIIIPIIVPSIIAIIIAVYFRYYAKTEHEKVYDSNRKISLTTLFSQLNGFGDYFESFYETVEKEIIVLENGTKKIIPSAYAPFGSTVKPPTFQEVMILQNKFKNVSKRIQPYVNRMNEYKKMFDEDYSTVLNYVHVTFLKDVARFYHDSIEWCDEILKNEHHHFLLEARKEKAITIIKYIKDQKIAEDVKPVSEFISKWEKRLDDLGIKI